MNNKIIEENEFLEIRISQEMSSNALPRQKVGKFVRGKISILLTEGRLTQDDISNLCNKEYCKRIFKLPYPLFVRKRTETKDKHGRLRYWVNKIEGYYVCNHWFEKNNRELFVKWLKKISARQTTKETIKILKTKKIKLTKK